MSFIDDPSSCGLTCSFCQPATMTQANALLVSRSYTVAFFQRYLRGRAEYDAWLVGASAQALFVSPGLVSLQSK
jgi:hypothetical protein